MISILAGGRVMAAENAKALPAEVSQFDFMAGDWEVTEPDGKVVGHNHLERILGSRVLFENWEGNGGYVGKSFSIYDVADGVWKQFWVDASGLVLELRGGMVDGSMVLSGQRLQKGKSVRDRIAWTPNPDGTVRQLWELSKDDGKTWSVVFDGLYHRTEE